MHKENLKGFLALTVCLSLVLFVSFVVKDLDKINRPSRLRRAIGFDLFHLSTSKASPNDNGIVIIIIGEDAVIDHGSEIIAQSYLFSANLIYA